MNNEKNSELDLYMRKIFCVGNFQYMYFLVLKYKHDIGFEISENLSRIWINSVRALDVIIATMKVFLKVAFLFIPRFRL